MAGLPHIICRSTLMAVLAALVTFAGCAGPLDRSQQDQFHDALIQSHRERLQATVPGEVVQVRRAPSEVEEELSDERKAQLDEMGGPDAYEGEPLNLGENLQGKAETESVSLSLEEAVRRAVEHNLDLQVARLSPAIAETQITQAEAAFDATFFSTVDWAKRDTPRPPGAVAGLANNQKSENLELTTGIRKPLTTGGEATIQTTLARQFEQPSVLSVERYYDADVLLSLTQPLLRNFGTEVNTAEIRLAQNARADQREQLAQQLLEVALNTEQAYWELLLTRHRLQVQSRLLERTIEDRDRLQKRAGFDVSPVRITEVNSAVEQRRADVIRARQDVRRASDRLKRLMNAPGLDVVGETLVLPSDDPVDAPIRFSIRDAVATALRHRPELQRAVIAIKDASIRQQVADNQRLPLLNVGGAVVFNGLGIDGAEHAYNDLDEMRFIDYVLRANFEYPLGYREGATRYKQRRLERRQAISEYRRTGQQAVLDVKNALREVLTAYELIGATRAARRAAADNLRAIQEQEDAGVALTPEFLLDLKLQAQQRLANAEIEEMQARTQYMSAIAQLYREMGTLLERNRINYAEAESGK